MDPRRSFFTLLRLVPLLFATCLASSLASANTYRETLIQTALQRGLPQALYWQTILHYRPRLVGGVKSEVGAPQFFNSPEGLTDPAAEMAATLSRFFEPMPEDPLVQHPQCLFIDRYQWLKKQLAFDQAQLPERPCKDYEGWRAALNPESVTLVFSSYYMGNPSSMFGHTLLRLNQPGRSNEERLLDYGVNYAANPTTTNIFLYSILGIGGGFPGIFSNIPYFLKVQEYNDTESRDLWEYDLNFTPEQVQQLIYHLWSVGHVQIPYYFFDRNCSYMILTLLDAGNPELKLASRFQGWTVIPADTVRAISQIPGLIKKVDVRPAIATRIHRQRARLTPEEDRAFLELIGSIEDGLPKTTGATIPVLDLALDYVRYLKIKGKNQLSASAGAFQKALLLARSELPSQRQDLSISEQEIARTRPDQGHETARVGLGSGFSSVDGGYAEAAWRATFHDMNASDRGYPRHAEIEMLSGALRYYPRPRQFALERLRILQITSLIPYERVFKKFSWSLSLAIDPVRDFACQNCTQGSFNGGMGLAFDPTPSLLVFFLAKAELAASLSYFPRYRLGPIATAGALIELSDRASLKLGAEYHQPVLGFTDGYYQVSAEARISLSTNLDLRLQADLFRAAKLGGVALNFYY